MSASLAGLSENGWRDTILRHHEVAPTLVSKPCQQGHFTKITRNHLATRKHDRQTMAKPTRLTPFCPYHSSGCPISDVSEPCWPQRKSVTRFCVITKWRQHLSPSHANKVTSPKSPETTWPHENMTGKAYMAHTFLPVPLFRVSR